MHDEVSISETSRLMFEPYLDDETRAVVESLGVGDRAYFWALLYYEMQRRNRKDFLRRAEDVARSRVKEVDFQAEGPVDATKPHGWFKVRIYQ